MKEITLSLALIGILFLLGSAVNTKKFEGRWVIVKLGDENGEVTKEKKERWLELKSDGTAVFGRGDDSEHEGSWRYDKKTNTFYTSDRPGREDEFELKKLTRKSMVIRHVKRGMVVYLEKVVRKTK